MPTKPGGKAARDGEPMPEDNYEKAERESRAAVRLLHTAAVHLFLRTPANRPQRRAPSMIDFDSATDVQRYRHFTQLFSNWIGQPERCALASCRRAKLCQGDPADCWRDEPPPTESEIDTAKWMLKDMFAEELARRRAAGEMPAASP
jgi:hypothetical protein